MNCWGLSSAMWIGSSVFFLPTLAWEANSGLTTLEQEELAFMKSLLEPLESEKRLASGFEPPSSPSKVKHL
jgi:hypothetical protein